MTIQDWIKSHKYSSVDELSKIIKNIPDKEFLSKQEMVEVIIELASETSKIYNAGLNDAIELISKCDSKFLKRKCPPHVLN